MKVSRVAKNQGRLEMHTQEQWCPQCAMRGHRPARPLFGEVSKPALP